MTLAVKLDWKALFSTGRQVAHRVSLLNLLPANAQGAEVKLEQKETGPLTKTPFVIASHSPDVTRAEAAKPSNEPHTNEKQTINNEPAFMDIRTLSTI